MLFPTLHSFYRDMSYFYRYYMNNHTRLQVTNTQYVYKWDLPGYSKENVVVQAEGSDLVVRAKSQDGLTYEDSRRIPGDALIDEATAFMKDGILTMEVPRRNTSPKRIVIQ